MENNNLKNKQEYSIRYCLDCESKVKYIDGMNTEYYGRLDYYKCKCCKERFDSRNGGELEIATL